MRPVLGHHRGDHPLGGALGEQRPGDLLDHPGLGPLAHADQRRCRCRSARRRRPRARPGRSPRSLKRSSSPSGGYQYSKSAVGEHRVGAVDRGHVVGLAPPGRPVHRVDRDAAVDPARRVAGEQGVRQRRQDEDGLVVEGGRDERRRLRSWPRSRPDSATVSPPMRWRASASGASAVRQAWTSSTRPARRRTPTPRARSAAADPRRWPRAPRRAGPGVQDLDAALAHPRDELVVLVLRPLDPQDVVEQQSSWLAGVSRCRLRSGRWTITWRSLPTSEWTPNDVIPSIPP